MKPEDKARLDAAIEHAETIVGSTHNIYEMRWIRGIIDEQAAEIARLEWPGPGEDDKPLPEDAAIDAAFPTRSGSHREYQEAIRLVGARRSKGGLAALVNWLLLQLAEERAKREAVEIRADLNVVMLEQKARADKAERELAEERAAHAKADAARVNLRDKLDTLTAHSNGVADEVERWCVVAADWKGRAEKAEAALATEREGGPHNYVHKTMFASVQELRAKAEARVAELQALVDAALPHCYARCCDKLATHSDPHLYGDYACDDHARCPMGRVHYAKYVIALAAKEKEPT